MAIKNIEAVRVDDGPIGEIFGCKIYSISLGVGYDKNPTTLSLNIVKEDGIYPDIDQYLSYLNPYKVDVDNVSIYLYLVKTSSRTSAETKTITLDFVDGSHILDRVFVGMVNKHTTSVRHMTTMDRYFQVPVCCPDCHGDPYADLSTTMKTVQAVRQISFSNGVPIGNNVDGGFIFVGVEGFAETDCEIGEFNYSFNDLVLACSNIGIKLDFPNPTAYNSFIRSHTGSLRSVLRSWCSEINYTFSWEWSNQIGKVNFINLNSDTTSAFPNKITEIKNVVDSMNTPDQPIVLDVQESTSIKETSKNYNVTFYQASNLQANQERSVNYLQHFASLYLDDIVHAAELGKSRSTPNFVHDRFDYAEFCTSMALSSVSQSAADIYNAMKGYIGYFGYTNWLKIPNGDRIVNGKRIAKVKATLVEAFSSGTSGIRDQIVKYYKNIFRLKETDNVSLSSLSSNLPLEWFDIYVGVKPNADVKTPASKSYEKQIASGFAGKYFWTYARPKKYRTCTKSITYEVGFDYTPSATDVFSPSNASDAANINKVNSKTPWYQLIGPKYGMQSFLWPQPSVVDAFGQSVRSIWSSTPIKVIEREAKFGNIVAYDVTNPLDGTVVKKGSPMSELCIDTCGIDIFAQFRPLTSKWKYGQPGSPQFGVKGHNAGMDEIFAYFEPSVTSVNGTLCGIDPFEGQTVEIIVAPAAFLVSKFMNVVPVEDYNGNFNLMGNPEEETYIQNIKQNHEPCQKRCDDQKNYINDNACDCDAEIFAGPGDLSGQTIEFQNALFSPQPSDEPHADGLYNTSTFGATLSFRRNNPWVHYVPHGTLAFDTHLNIALPTASFRINVDKYTPQAKDAQQIPTDASYNSSQWFRTNFHETVKFSYTLPKDTSVKNTFNTSLPGNVAKISVNEKNVTSDLRRIDGNCADAASVINMYVPSVGFVDLDTYHNLYSALVNTGSEYPRKTVNVTLAGINLGALNSYASVLNGLSSWQISMDTQGYKTSISWQNKPINYPSEELGMVALRPEMVFPITF